MRLETLRRLQIGFSQGDGLVERFLVAGRTLCRITTHRHSDVRYYRTCSEESPYFNHFGVKQTFLSVLLFMTVQGSKKRRPFVAKMSAPQGDEGGCHPEPPNCHPRMYLSGIQSNF